MTGRKSDFRDDFDFCVVFKGFPLLFQVIVLHGYCEKLRKSFENASKIEIIQKIRFPSGHFLSPS